ncbi:MAG TPA: ABC transporter ATP-binding protein [Peptococcaceae bacterium]|nr:ABC transporter ATP-binding protein [Peptococcaceae bacterium]
MLRKKNKILGNSKGFTLVELIVVIAILGILAAVLIPQFTGFQDKARSTQLLVEAKQFATAADALLIETDGVLPAQADVLAVAGDEVDGTLIGGYDLNTTGLHVVFTYTDTLTTGTIVTITREDNGSFTTELS